MFHGDEINGPDQSSNAHLLGDDLSQPLRLIRTGRIVPHVFSPSVTLVVSADVREKLETLPHIDFLPVVFEKLVDYQFRAGDFSYFDLPAFRRNPAEANPETLLQRLPDIPELHSQIGSYYEVVVPRLGDIADNYTNLKHFSVKLEHCIGKVECDLSAEIIYAYPIVWRYANIFSEEAFALVSPFIDWDYFSTATIEL
jgi:hypothetical protein